MTPSDPSDAGSSARRWPAQTDYQDAIVDPAVCFIDPELQRSTPAELLPFGLPRPITGQFANVYQMRLASGASVAVRLFLSPRAERASRYAAVENWLAGLGETLPAALVGFRFQPEGFVVEGQRLPLLVMDWVNGIPLSEFIERHLQESQRLAALAEQWNALTQSLAAARIAHGDLQHGNILVESAPGDRLRLVDYDGMWVPTLTGALGLESGHPAYRHRDWRPEHFGPDIDRLPALVIYTSLRAVSVAPDVWYRLHDGDNLLFRQQDLTDPFRGRAFAVLAETMGLDRETARLVQELKRAAAGRFGA